MAKGSHYDKDKADFAVSFIECLCHTKGTWAGKNFELIDWQEQIIRDVFGTIKANGYRQFNTAFIEVPKKNGKRVDMIQPTLWEDENGVHMFVITNAGRIYRSDSKTAGKTWCKAYETELLNNNSGIDAVSLSDGSLVLVSNPIGENWGDRSPLTLMRSFDGGKTFEEFYKLESKIGDFEFSYPAITAVNKKLYITYTYERKTIKYAEIEID